jgi:hypothetical protein
MGQAPKWRRPYAVPFGQSRSTAPPHTAALRACMSSGPYGLTPHVPASEAEAGVSTGESDRGRALISTPCSSVRVGIEPSARRLPLDALR